MCVCVCVYTASHCVYVCEQGGVCVCTVLPTVRVSVCVNTPSHHPPPPCPRPFPPTNKAGITGSISRANTGIQSFPCGGNGSRILIRGTRACIGQGARGASGDEQLGPGASTLIRGSCYYFQPASIQWKQVITNTGCFLHINQIKRIICSLLSCGILINPNLWMKHVD